MDADYHAYLTERLADARANRDALMAKGIDAEFDHELVAYYTEELEAIA